MSFVKFGLLLVVVFLCAMFWAIGFDELDKYANTQGVTTGDYGGLYSFFHWATVLVGGGWTMAGYIIGIAAIIALFLFLKK
ncbi:hypothetical protein [Methanocella sp. MCL-LM]|uniref:hypothetical protein n=1 Tax=Methanocella sp. MCL-LM TaxID=3412035 RepID=UPI003C70F3D4